jgi:hypothetical protein
MWRRRKVDPMLPLQVGLIKRSLPTMRWSSAELWLAFLTGFVAGAIAVGFALGVKLSSGLLFFG